MRIKGSVTTLFLLSLFSILINTPIGVVAIADIFIFFVAARQLSRGYLVGWSVQSFFLALIVLVLTIQTFIHIFDTNFNLSSHFKSLARLVCVFIFLNSLEFRNLLKNKYDLRKAILVVLHFHSIIVLIDFFAPMPLEWGEYTYFELSDYHRARGLFGEPSYVAIYILSNLFVLACIRKLRVREYATPILALLATKSFIGLIGVGVLFTLLPSRFLAPRDAFIFLVLVGSIFLSVLTNSRAAVILTDTSALKRVVGAYLSIDSVFDTNPLIGFGLGGANAERIPVRSSVELISEADMRCMNAGTCNPIIMNSYVNSFAVVVAGGGLTLLILYSALVWSVAGASLVTLLFLIFILSAQGSPFASYILPFMFMIAHVDARKKLA